MVMTKYPIAGMSVLDKIVKFRGESLVERVIIKPLLGQALWTIFFGLLMPHHSVLNKKIVFIICGKGDMWNRCNPDPGSARCKFSVVVYSELNTSSN